MKIQRDRLVIWIGLLTIELYWPMILHTLTDTGIYLPTQISHKRAAGAWDWVKWAFVLKVLGFGVGLAWKHVDNPNREEE